MKITRVLIPAAHFKEFRRWWLASASGDATEPVTVVGS
jgi:hypothetical protein